MVTLLASIAGFIGSIFPEILRFFRDKNDKQHELAILDRQIKFSQKGAQYQLEEIQLRHDMAQQAELYTTYKTGINWIDALNGTVRPVLAYAFFGMYMGIKLLQYLSIKYHKGQLFEYMHILWSLEDQAIFASIISFYFGQRTFNKMWQRK